MDLIKRLASNILANLHLVAVFAAFWVIDLLAQRRLRSVGLEPRAIAGLTLWLGSGAMLGARTVYILPTASVFYRHPLDVIQVNAGLSFYGALAGGAVGALLYQRARRVPFLAVADAYLLFIPLGIAIFRLTCFLHGPCWGRATDTWIGIQFPGLSIPRYPSELYEGIFVLGLFAVLFQIDLRKPTPGLVSAVFLIGYAMVRGLTDMTRIQAGFWPAADPWLAFAMGLLGVIGLLAVLSSARSAIQPPQAVRQRRHRR